jgi:hypothetical protein
VSAIALLFLPGQTSEALSPRPGKPEPADAQASGGTIKLLAQFPSSWPWDKTDWQDLWTIVQWKDNKEIWHDVAGWQGTLDTVETGMGDVIVGHKTWWVDESDLGKGPFRWQVYRNVGGQLLTTSEPFDLPEAKGGMVIVGVDLTP